MKFQKDEVSPRSFISNKTYPTTHTEGSQFRQPMLPTRTGHPQHFEPYRINMNVSRPEIFSFRSFSLKKKHFQPSDITE